MQTIGRCPKVLASTGTTLQQITFKKDVCPIDFGCETRETQTLIRHTQWKNIT